MCITDSKGSLLSLYLKCGFNFAEEFDIVISSLDSNFSSLNCLSVCVTNSKDCHLNLYYIEWSFKKNLIFWSHHLIQISHQWTNTVLLSFCQLTLHVNFMEMSLLILCCVLILSSYLIQISHYWIYASH